MFNVPAFLDSLQYMAKGMTGVFLVIAAIILSIYLGFKEAEWTKRMKKGCVLSDKFPFSNHEQAPQSFRSLRRLFFTFFLSALRWRPTGS